MPHGCDQQLQKDHIQHHHQAHGAEHSAPTLEDVGGILTATSGKGQRRKDHQNSRDHIPFGNLKKELYELPHNNEVHDDDQQPGCPDVKVVFIGQADGDAVGDLEQLNDAGGNAKPDVADLPAGQKQEAKHKGPHEQQLWVLTFKAQTGHHALCGLEHQITQQQRPPCRNDNGYDLICYRGDPPEIVQIHGEHV